MAEPPRPDRLDVVLVHRGLARSRRSAAEMVSQGRVRVGGAVATKPSFPVREPDTVQVEPDEAPQYVSRAAHKLVSALDAVRLLAPGAVPLVGARCLDAGASTGGFTQVLLEQGAAQVWAVDVGHGQIDPVVGQDPRVVVREGINVRHLTADDVGGEPKDVVVADLSFISLTVVMAALVSVTRPGGQLLLMVKPQFEIGRDRLGSSGVVSSPLQREESVLRVARSALEHGAQVLAVAPSGLPGPSGNQEYFLWLQIPAASRGEAAGPHGDRGSGLASAVAAAVRHGRAALVRTSDTEVVA